MSDFHAIGGVSATLQALLKDRMELPPGVARDSLIIVGPPPRPSGTDPQEAPRVNIFLYRITENGNLKNQEIPGTGHPAAYGHPPLSLDLHYLITGHGTGEDGAVVNETLGQFLLGSAMRVLHNFPVITDDLQTTSTPLPQPILHNDLRDQFENIKVTLEPLSLEDLSKVWTALTIQFRPAAAYLVNVVQIESQRRRFFPQPVGEPPGAGPRTYVVPLRYPRINNIHVKRNGEHASPYARIGDTLILQGHNFSGENVRVIIDELDIPVDTVADDRIEVKLPDDPRLQPSPHSVEVLVQVQGLPQTGFHSNTATFMLVPKITALHYDPLGVPRALRINGSRLFMDSGSGEAFIWRALIPKSSYIAVSTSSQITVPIPDILPSGSVPCLVSGSLLSFPSLPAAPTQPDLKVTIGTTTKNVNLPARLSNLSEAVVYLQAAIRNAANGNSSFLQARVGTVGNRLIVVAGGLTEPVSCAVTQTNDLADRLKLTATTGATQESVYYSGSLSLFPVLTNAVPRVNATIGGASATLTLTPRPSSIASAVSLLETQLRAVAGWGAIRVGILGDHMLIFTGGLGAITFDAVPGPSGDAATVVELQLHANYAIRVRVNGAESIDPVTLELPQ